MTRGRSLMGSFNVMTLNIRGALAPDGVNAWPRRRDLMRRVIRQHAPDLIGFQEVHNENWDWFGGALPEYDGRTGPPYNNHEPFQHPSILWRRDVLTPVDEGQFWLSETPEIHSASWGTDCIRSALSIRFRLRESGRTFVHLNTHLDHVSEPARVNGARLILARLADLAHDLPTIVTADFNTDPGTPVYRLFRDAGLQDAHLAAGGTDGPEAFTFHRFTGRRELGRIDWILLSPEFDVASCRVVTDAEPPVYPSDHFPVIAEVSLG